MSASALPFWGAPASATNHPLSSWNATTASCTMPQSLFGYDIIDRIGEGAGSTLYAVSAPKTKQIYALKHVVRKRDKDIRFVEQLETEYDVGRKVTHPNLRKSIDFQTKRSLIGRVNEAGLVLELFDGQPLEFNLPHSLVAVLDVFIRTSRALDALHAAGYLHCDLKPNNILLGPRGEVKVIDLGQACPIGTKKTRIQGTPDYIAPEQVKLKPVTMRTDIYNLGATMYWATSGQKLPTLFTVQNSSKNAFLLDEYIPAPHQHNPQVPENLSNFIMECVRTNPLKRPAHMGDVIRRLETLKHSVAKLGAAQTV